MASAVSTKRAEFSVAVVLAIVVPATIAALWPSLSSLWTYWGQIQAYNHGYLIAAISLCWLVIAARPIGALPAQPSLAGSVLLAGSLLAWLVALRANIEIGHQLLLPAGIWLTILAAAGWPAAGRVLAPIAFLYFSVPIWDYLVPVLQWLSVSGTEWILAIIGVPAQIREYHVTIPEGSFQIVEDCSGKRYFMVALAIAVLASAINRMRGSRRLGFLVASGVLALVANWIRIVIVIYAGHATNMQHYFVAVEHKTLGNVIFAILLIAIFVLARLATPAHAHVAVKPALSPGARSFPAIAAVRWQAAMPLLLLAVTFALVQLRALAFVAPPTLGTFPLAAGYWLGPLPAGRPWMPEYVLPVEERRVAYISGASTVELYVNLYGEQRQGQELVYYGNVLLAPGNWTRPWPPVTRSVGGILTTVEARDPDGRQWLVAYTFKVGGFMTRSELASKLAYGIMSILSPAPSGVVALAVRCEGNCESARALVASFWDDMSGSILAVIPDTLGGPGS